MPLVPGTRLAPVRLCWWASGGAAELGYEDHRQQEVRGSLRVVTLGGVLQDGFLEGEGAGLEDGLRRSPQATPALLKGQGAAFPGLTHPSYFPS